MIEKFIQTYIKEKLNKCEQKLHKDFYNFFSNFKKFVTIYLIANAVFMVTAVVMSFIINDYSEQIMRTYYIISLFSIIVYYSFFVYMGRIYLKRVMTFDRVSNNMKVINDSITFIFDEYLDIDRRQKVAGILASAIENKKKDKDGLNANELIKMLLPCFLSPLFSYVIDKYSLLSNGLLSLSNLLLSLIFIVLSDHISSQLLHICSNFDFSLLLSLDDYNNIINDLNIYKSLLKEYIHDDFNNNSICDKKCTKIST